MAKLGEILARELKEWKKNADGAVFSSKGAACYFFHGNKPAYDNYNWRATEGCFWFFGESNKLVLNGGTPDDHATAIVTRAEWQAAVDALKAKDIVSTAVMIDAGWIDPRPPVSPSLHAQVVGRANRTPEWNGVGLPPVGMVCEWAGCTCAPEDPREPDLHVGDSVKIIVHFKDGDFDLAAFTFNPQVHNSARGSAWVNQGGPGCFRPIRTPEQIAAEEREAEVNRMVATVPMLDKGWARKVCYALYDNNYRKQEPK